MGSSAIKAPEAFTTKLPWLALNMACMTWPALRTQLAQYVAAPGAVQRLQEAGISPLETALPGLTEKLGVVRQGRAFTREIERLQATEISLTTLEEADYLRPYAGSLNRRRCSISGGRCGTKTAWPWQWLGHGSRAPMANWRPSV